MPEPLPVLLMLRPQRVSERFVAQLSGLGSAFRPVISPRFDIVYCGELPRMARFAGVVFTSVHGVSGFRVQANDAAVELPAYAVGDATAQAARALGFRTWSAQGNADTLVAGLTARGVTGPLLHVRGVHSRGDVAARLTHAGIRTEEVVLYDQPLRPLTLDAQHALADTVPVVAPLFSPRTARLLAEEPIIAPLLVAAMSEAVVNAAASLHIRDLRIAPRPDSAAMLALTSDLLVLARAREKTPSQTRHGNNV